MLSLTTAATCKQCRRNAHKLKCIAPEIYNSSLLIHSRYHSRRQSTIAKRSEINNSTLTTIKIYRTQKWNPSLHIPTMRSLSTNTSNRELQEKSQEPFEDRYYDTVLSVALDQSNSIIAQSLLENTFLLLRKGSTDLAWECYRDLSSQNVQKYISRDQYARLVRKFYHQPNRALGLEAVLTLVEDMKQLGYKVGRKERLLVLQLLGQNGMIKEMEKVYTDFKNDNLLIVSDEAEDKKAFNIMITAYEGQKKTIGNKEAALNIMKIYEDMLYHCVKPNARATTALLESIRSAGYSDDMVEKLSNWAWPKMVPKTSELQLDPVIYQNIACYFANAGRPDYALQVNDIMIKNNIPRTLQMMTALIHKVGRAGDIERAMELFDEMVHKDGIQPSLVTFNVLIDVHAHKRPEPDVEGANRAYDMLREAGLQPDTYTFATLIDMFAKQKDFKMLRRIYRYMYHNKKIRPNEYVASSIVECFIKLGDLNSALGALRMLRGAGAKTTVMLDLVFKGLISSGRAQDAFSLVGSMRYTEFGPKASTFMPLLEFYANRGDADKVQKVATLLTKANLPTKPQHLLAALLKAHAKSRNIGNAERIFEAYTKKWQPTVFVYNSLLYAYVMNNEMDKVLEIYSRMSTDNIKPDVNTYGILMHFYSRRGDVRAVEVIMDTMKANNIKPSVTCETILMQTYFEASLSSDARSVMERMLQAGLRPTSQTWSILVNGCAKSNELEYAESILQEAIDRSKVFWSHQPNFLKNVTSAVVKTHALYDSYVPETIEDILEKTHPDLGTQPNILSAYLFTPLIDAYSKKGNFTKAKQLFKTMLELRIPITVPTYVTLMSMFQNEKHYDAVETMWNALRKPGKAQTCINNIDPDIDRIPLPEKYYDYLHLLKVTDAKNIQVIEPTEEPIPEQASQFALSVYIDSLVEQKRNQDVENLWNELEAENYQFDEQNLNRYLVSLLTEDKLDKACNMVSAHFFASNVMNEKSESSDQPLVPKTMRKRDKLDIDTGNQLHDRTCLAFATKFDIPGAENMGVFRLRSTVIERIKSYLRKE
ncbi:hypothetical protein CU097_011749 [Rhizopus azygosporus]|uniref:PROP1-like PPR domain-containing protein n=1 Tax=Rhizopus azygosporus TaxID=86630 RepID=A0A367K1M9_RHIAZ|nr:hypothetical protein CU097_011749 [Rhizopus azygosporus]